MPFTEVNETPTSCQEMAGKKKKNTLMTAGALLTETMLP